MSAVCDLFLELAAIPSPPGEERAVADVVAAHLRTLGLEPDEDAAGEAIGSQIGNIYARIAPTVEGGTPIFLNAHLDTVPPTAAVRPEVRNGIVVNAEDTILGADNKAAVAAMLVAVERIVAEGIDHAGIELVLTPMEEVGLQGAKQFDVSRLHASFGYCYDHAAPIGNIVMAAPTQRTLRLRFVGRAAHSGIAPEQGRSAIAAAARAISDMRLGRIDAETTANVGLIRGGIAGNIIPPECTVMAEARSRDPGRVAELAREMLDAATHAANLHECELESTITSEYEGYRFVRSHPAVRMASAALEACGHAPTSLESGGGADANVFNAAGVACVNLCNGMAEIHTAAEHIAVSDLEAMTAVTLELIAQARSLIIPSRGDRGGTNMKIGVAKEIKADEYRVALTTAGVVELVLHGHEVLVEQGAGLGSSMSDDDYRAAGATIVWVDDVWSEADMVLKVKEPLDGEWQRLRPGKILFTYLHLAAAPELTRGWPSPVRPVSPTRRSRRPTGGCRCLRR